MEGRGSRGGTVESNISAIGYGRLKRLMSVVKEGKMR